MEGYRHKRENSEEGFVPLRPHEEMLYNVEKDNSKFNPHLLVQLILLFDILVVVQVEADNIMLKERKLNIAPAIKKQVSAH